MLALAQQGVLSFSQHCFNKDPGERSSQASGTRETDNMQREFKMNSNKKESRNLQCGRIQISPPSAHLSLLSVLYVQFNNLQHYYNEHTHIHSPYEDVYTRRYSCQVGLWMGLHDMPNTKVIRPGLLMWSDAMNIDIRSDQIRSKRKWKILMKWVQRFALLPKMYHYNGAIA